MGELCPGCQQALPPDAADLCCPHCEQNIVRQAICPDCGQPLQVLKACGAVDYFCQQHGLISKKSVKYSLQAQS